MELYPWDVPERAGRLLALGIDRLLALYVESLEAEVWQTWAEADGDEDGDRAAYDVLVPKGGDDALTTFLWSREPGFPRPLDVEGALTHWRCCVGCVALLVGPLAAAAAIFALLESAKLALAIALVALLCLVLPIPQLLRERRHLRRVERFTRERGLPRAPPRGDRQAELEADAPPPP